MAKRDRYSDDLAANLRALTEDPEARALMNGALAGFKNEYVQQDKRMALPVSSQISVEVAERLSSMDTLTGHPGRTPKQDTQFPPDRLDRCKIYLSGVFEGVDTWPNLVEHGLTEKHLEEALEAREANGIPKGTFREDMDILEHAFADPKWVRASLIKASIANGAPTPRPGYESPAKARQRASRAQLEELRKVEKEQEEIDFELWQLQLSDDERWMILNTHKLEQERIWLRAEFTKRRKADGQD